MEDVDTPRNVPGAAAQILATLEAFGFEWDGPVLWQSQRLAAYAEALAQLQAAGLAYGCACSRKEIADSATRRDRWRAGLPWYLPPRLAHRPCPGVAASSTR
jgi:glutamyl-Q tRNA(Asp) synthetase